MTPFKLISPVARRQRVAGEMEKFSRAFFSRGNKPKTKVEVIPTGLAFSDGNSCDFQFLAPLSEVRHGKRREEAR
jgi:hypothetical protein